MRIVGNAEAAAAVKRAVDAPGRTTSRGHHLALAVDRGDIVLSAAMSHAEWPEAEGWLKLWERFDCIEIADQRIIAWMPVEYMEGVRAAQGEPDALAIVQKEWPMLGYYSATAAKVAGTLARKSPMGQKVVTEVRQPSDGPSPWPDACCVGWVGEFVRRFDFGAQGPPAYHLPAIWGADAEALEDLGPTMLELYPCTCPDCVDGPEAKPEPECDVWLISPTSLPASMRSGAQNGKGKARTRTMVYDFEEVP